MTNATQVSANVVSAIVGGLKVGEKPVTVILEDGSKLSARMELDFDSDLMNDGDWFGRVEYCNYGDQRPRGFDGNAEKMSSRNCVVWWQPPSDVQRGTDSFNSLRKRVAGYYAEDWRYVGIVLEKTSYCTADRRYSREQRASLWSIESDADAGFLSEVVSDLLHQLSD